MDTPVPHEPTGPDAPAPPPCRRFRLILTLALLPTLVLLLEPCRLALASWWHLRDFPLQLDGEEGFVLDEALKLARGELIYRPIDTPPHLVGNHPPLYPALYGLAHRIVLGERARPASLPLGRLIAQLSALVAALAVGGVAWRLSRSAAVAVLAALLLASGWEFNHWGHFARVDLTSVALSVAGLWVAAVARRPLHWMAAALVLVAAGYTRQTAVAAPLAVALALVTGRSWRAAGWFIGTYAAVGLALLLVLQLLTRGEFWRHTVVYNANAFDWHGWRLVMRNEVWHFYRWLLVALVAVAPLLLCRGEGDGMAPDRPAPLRWLAPLYFLFSLPSILGYAKIGASPNYVLEPLAAAAILVADLIGRAPTAPRGRIFAIAALAAGVLALTAHAARTAFNPAVRVAHVMFLRLSELPSGPVMAVVDAARRAPGDVLAEQAIVPLLAGKPVVFEPFIMSQLAREGHWDATPFLDRLRRGEFGCLILNDDLATGPPAERDRWTAGMVRAVREAYEPVGAVTLPTGVYYFWQPAAPARPAVPSAAEPTPAPAGD